MGYPLDTYGHMLQAWGIVASARASRGMVEELRPHHIGTDVKSECADRGLVFIGRSGVHQEGIQLRGLYNM